MSTELRTQFIHYMALQRLSPHTKRNYIRAVKGLAEFYNQSPDTLTNDQIQDYLRYLLEERKLSWGTCNNYFGAQSHSLHPCLLQLQTPLTGFACGFGYRPAG